MLTILLTLAAVAAATSFGLNADDDDPKGPAAKLAGDWKLIKLGEDKVPADVEITLSVTAEGKVSGSTGVNRFFGGLAKEISLFGPLGMTRKAGPPEAMERESAYTKALGEVTAFAIEKDQLTLSAGDKPRLVFERIKPDEPK
jgi:heat shock protein HslJ